MAKREIHNGHDLWAELLRILLSGPKLGMCSRNADAGSLQGHLCPQGREEEGVGGSVASASSVEEVRVTPMGRQCRPPVGTRHRLQVERFLRGNRRKSGCGVHLPRVQILTNWLCDLGHGA